jgi:hypothetical protein
LKKKVTNTNRAKIIPKIPHPHGPKIMRAIEPPNRARAAINRIIFDIVANVL